MSPTTLDLIFTVAASGALIMMLVSVAALLPWRDSELEDAEDAFRALAAPASRAPLRVRRPDFLSSSRELPVYGHPARR